MMFAALAACGGGGGGGGGSGSAGPSVGIDVEAGAGAGAGNQAAGGAGGGGNLGTIPVQSDIVDGGRNVVPTAYVAMAAQMSRDAGLGYRYGPDPAAYGTAGNGGRPTLTARDDNNSYDPISIRLPGGNRGCVPSAQGGYCGTWQIGGPLVMEPGDYSSSIVHAAYVADNASASVGVANLQAISMGHNTFAQKPESSWASGPADSGINELNALSYIASGKAAREPVAVARCYRTGWCTNSLMVFQGGLIGTAGSNTSRNRATVQLAAGKVPTAISVTPGGEFALVTVWDTTQPSRPRGQVAVVALASLCDGCTVDQPGAWYNNWGGWGNLYPGLPNLGNIAYMKVLGYVDLPDSMRAPTEISSSTGIDFESYRVHDAGGGLRDYWSMPLTDAQNRKSFLDGNNSGAYARAGVAVVISKSEQRAAFIDLRPLFSYYRDKYFGGEQGDFNSLIAGRGDGAGQWPYTFDAAPTQKPVVVKTEDFSAKPTAVSLRLNGAARAFVATQEGQLHIYDLGNYLRAAGGGAAAEIVRRGAVAVGRNPTHIAYVKPHGSSDGSRKVYADGYEREVIVTSRADRRLDWVKFAADFNSGVVRKSLSDTRLIDPIAVEDAENHGTESYVLSVADYGGKKVSNYRYGPVVFWTNTGRGWTCQPPGGCPTSGDFEFGGSFALPGRPFQVAGSNIP